MAITEDEYVGKHRVPSWSEGSHYASNGMQINTAVGLRLTELVNRAVEATNKDAREKLGRACPACGGVHGNHTGGYELP